jgi:hypothetical protein
VFLDLKGFIPGKMRIFLLFLAGGLESGSQNCR